MGRFWGGGCFGLQNSVAGGELIFRVRDYLMRIFRDVCALKSSRSPPYAAARNFCTLKIFYMPACSIFGAPKFSIRTKIFDMRDEKFSGSTHPTFRTSRDATYAVKMAYQHNRQKIFLGGQPKRLRFLPPNGGV